MGTQTPNSQAPQDRLAYFEPGEIVLLVDHDEAAQADDPRTLLKEALKNADAGEEMMRLADNLRYEPANTFNPADEVILPLRNRSTRFSLLFAEVQDELRGFREFAASIERFNQVAVRIGPGFTGSATFRGASPNWLTTPYQDAAGGSPGARPRPLNGAAAQDFGRFHIEGLPAEGLEGLENVEVVILDTAPDCRRLERATNDQELLQSNWLLGELATMLRDGSFQITCAGEYGIDLPLLNATEPPELYKVQDHDYDMRDHGLFVAGIVHSIARRARLRIIEVLNQRGIGTLQGIVRALQILLDERRQGANTPLIINCSFGLTMPLAGHSIRDLDWPLLVEGRPKDQQDKDAWRFDPQLPPRQELQNWWDLMMRLRLDLASVCASLRGPNVRIVAAAGNDGDAPVPEEAAMIGLARPQARYPAALPGVIGVGAIDEQGNPLVYSNMSDDPTCDGYATFGGAALAGVAPAGAAAGEEGAAIARENAGMLGAYIGKVPPAQAPNQSGWAWWAGTSFAAPIISAVLANFAAQRGTLNAAENDLRNIANSNPVQDLGRVLVVTQDP